MSEAQEQKALIKYVAIQYPYLYDYMFAIPNGGYRRIIEATSLKAQGVRPGVPDIFIAYPTADYHGLFIEMKDRKKGNVSLAQRQWIEKLNKIGYRTVVCYGWEEAKFVIQEYLDLLTD